MANDADDLPEDVDALKAKVHELNAQLSWYEEQFRLHQNKRFAASQDTAGDEQGQLFNEPEREQQRDRRQSASRKAKKGRSNKGGGRRALPQDLPRETRVYEASEAERQCDCGAERHVVDTEVTERVEHEPGKVYVVEHHQPRYGCRHCENGVHRAAARAAPLRLLPGILGSPVAASRRIALSTRPSR